MCEWVNDKNKTHCILSHFLSITIYLRVYSTKSTTTLNSISRWRCIFYKLLFPSTTTENECPIAANLTWLVSEGSLIFHHASTASNYNQSQWSCTRLILAVVSRADSDPDSRIWHAASFHVSSSTVLSETMREMPSWIWGRGKNSRGTLQLSKDHSALRQSTHQNFGFSWG